MASVDSKWRESVVVTESFNPCLSFKTKVNYRLFIIYSKLEFLFCRVVIFIIWLSLDFFMPQVWYVSLCLSVPFYGMPKLFKRFLVLSILFCSCNTSYNTLIVSSASSITAHCLGLKALASSRPMCSCETDQTKESVYTTDTAHACRIYLRYISFVGGFYCCCCLPFFITLSFESWPSSLAALKIIWVPCDGETNRRMRWVFERYAVEED